jgi:hypothetical protein
VAARHSARWSWAVSAAIVVGAVGAPSAAACVGGRLLEGSTPLEAATAVFTGTVVRRDEPVRLFMFSSADPIAWTVVVDAVQKGDIDKQVTVYSPRNDASCGIDFVLGGRYEMFAYGSDGRLEVGQGDVQQIGALADAPAVEAGWLYFDDVGSVMPVLTILAVAGLVVGGSVAAFVGVRRQRNGP